MPKFHLSLQRETAEAGQVVEAPGVFGAIWPVTGRLSIEGNGTDAPDGTEFLQGRKHIRAVDSPATWLRFSLSDAAPESATLLRCDEVDIEQERVLLRLDTVTFPPGAVAWRHVHPGPGIRHLLQGDLTLKADDHEVRMRAGESWFEAAHSPVRANASTDAPKTAFVRFMILPIALQGQPSIQILDSDDLEKPRLQVTRRFIDQVVRLPHGR
ncbi:cupin domain-containing protein [Tropicimonas sp. TH_r6]|uniref:cupin domain-containing protein n=1 Tax=Tropicimonas sp. TH_r6 TaxID=3082085 RepID=UPI0029539A0C|nr:cupin domain-containing protein [Tropicimonas sp. TH_r6]MDV7142194.1 cupin domain-containing protein [Tropicimonas sp. TH_r6]